MKAAMLQTQTILTPDSKDLKVEEHYDGFNIKQVNIQVGDELTVSVILTWRRIPPRMQMTCTSTNIRTAATAWKIQLLHEVNSLHFCASHKQKKSRKSPHSFACLSTHKYIEYTLLPII